VRRHGGELVARSTPHHGTTFVIDLPAETAAHQRERSDDLDVEQPRRETLN
jgi:K+-sensing histidine kinase KdpD